MRVLVASNPASGSARRASIGALVADRLEAAGHRVRAIVAADFASLERTVAEHLAEADVLVAVGGDGIVHLAVNVLASRNSNIPLAVVPAGSGNDFARTLGLVDRDGVAGVIARLPGIIEQQPWQVDLVRVTAAHSAAPRPAPDAAPQAEPAEELLERYVVGIVSVGFDADVNRRANAMRWVPAALRYEVAILATVLRPKHRSYTITIDGERSTVRTLIAAVANQRTLGGGIPLAPSADPRDGMLTTVVADRLSLSAFLALLPRALRGTHVEDARVHVSRANRVTIEGADLSRDGRVVAYGDGEVIGELPISCEIVPGAIRVFGATQ